MVQEYIVRRRARGALYYAIITKRSLEELVPSIRFPVTYMIGSVASYWLIVRVGTFWH